MIDPHEPLGVGSTKDPPSRFLQLGPLEKADVVPFGLGWNEARRPGALRGAGSRVSMPGPRPSAPAFPLERSQSKFHSLWSSAARDCGHGWVRPGSYFFELEFWG